MAVHEFDCRSLPINKVTVFNDRAEINRLVAFELKQGTNEVHVMNVTSQMIPDSVRVNGRGGATIHEVHLQDKPVVATEKDTPKIAEKRTEVQNKEDELNSVRDKKSVLEKKLEDLETILGEIGSNVGPAEKVPYVINETMLDGLTKLFGFYNDASTKIRQELRTAQRSIKQLEQEVQKARNELKVLEQGNNNKQLMKCIVVVLESESGGTAELDVIYQTYGASWSPKFDIRVDTNEKTPKMEISYYGNVKQGTNEDWNDCPLILSTAQSRVTGQVPDLGTLEISIRRPPQQLPVKPMKSTFNFGPALFSTSSVKPRGGDSGLFVTARSTSGLFGTRGGDSGATGAPKGSGQSVFGSTGGDSGTCGNPGGNGSGLFGTRDGDIGDFAALCNKGVFGASGSGSALFGTGGGDSAVFGGTEGGTGLFGFRGGDSGASGNSGGSGSGLFGTRGSDSGSFTAAGGSGSSVFGGTGGNGSGLVGTRGGSSTVFGGTGGGSGLFGTRGGDSTASGNPGGSGSSVFGGTGGASGASGNPGGSGSESVFGAPGGSSSMFGGTGGGSGLFGSRKQGSSLFGVRPAPKATIVEDAAPEEPPMESKRATATVSEDMLKSEFTVERKKPIPSDGAQHKVTIGVINLQPSLIYECIPLNTSGYPLLQGEAAVYLNKAFVTKTNLKNVSPNERFSCSLGVDAALRVEYKPVKKYHEQVGVISKSSSNVTEQLVVVKNTKNVIALLTLKEHIPRSTDERIKIRVVNPVIPASSADISEDSIPVEGVRLSSANNLEWTAKIPAQKSQEFLVKYILEHPKEEKVDFCEKF